MKPIKLIAILSLTAALTTDIAFAQGNPHIDPQTEPPMLASLQGNPHIGFEATTTASRYVEHYRGNPHEGDAFSVIRVASSQGNPHKGFKIAPLTIASY